MLTRMPAVLLAATIGFSASTSTATADTSLPDALNELERHAEDLLGPEARRAVESLLPMIETLMERLPIVIENLPDYEMPEIMPNGDIIIRRKRKLPRIDPEAPPMPNGGIKT